jgi:hypothetical protein
VCPIMRSTFCLGPSHRTRGNIVVALDGALLVLLIAHVELISKVAVVEAMVARRKLPDSFLAFYTLKEDSILGKR